LITYQKKKIIDYCNNYHMEKTFWKLEPLAPVNLTNDEMLDAD